MSGSPVNIQRDAYWTNPDTTDDIALGNSTLQSLTNLDASGPTTVFQDSGSAQVDAATTTIAADNQKTIGVYMAQPDGDNTPYRVKAACRVMDTPDAEMSIVIGYAPATITGANDLIQDLFYIPFKHNFDDLIMVPESDTYSARALFIGVAIQGGAGITGKRVNCSISVQRLATKPPTMQNAVS